MNYVRNQIIFSLKFTVTRISIAFYFKCNSNFIFNFYILKSKKWICINFTKVLLKLK